MSEPENSLSNLFTPAAAGSIANLPEEVVQQLVSADNVRIERIVSQGHASPPDFWYDQDEHEWVVVLSGAAKLQIEGEDQPREMGPGDFEHLPAHQRHRVEWTTAEEPTVWLAVFYG